MSLMVFKEFFLEIISHIVANHSFESISFLMERIDANHTWVTDDVIEFHRFDYQHMYFKFILSLHPNPFYISCEETKKELKKKK